MSRRISAVFVLVLVLALSACASSRFVRDAQAIRAARGDLAGVTYGFSYYRHMSVWDMYPAPATITSHEDLIDVLSPIAFMPPPEMTDWTFVSYARPRSDWFELRVRAHDKQQTVLLVTRNGIEPINP